MNVHSSNLEVTAGSRKRKQQAEETRARLIDTALILFAQKGYENTSVKEIAREANVAQGLLYNYFPSKEDLFWAVLDAHGFGSRLPSILARFDNRSVAEVLNEIGQAMHAHLVEHKPMVQLLTREAQISPRVAEVFNRYIREEGAIFREFLERRIAGGELRPHNPIVTIRMLISAVLVSHLLNMANSEDTHAYIEDVITTLMRGIAV